MAKIILLGDTHLGARNGSNHFSRYFNRFYTEVLYPYAAENEVRHIIQTGDLFDNRTQLSIKAYSACKTPWFEPLRDLGIKMHVLLGNHDIFYKSSLEVNSPELFLANEYRDNIIVYNKPAVVDIVGTTIALIPWICDSNKQEVFDFLNRDKIADLCVGHFEIEGFDMMRGVPGHGGLPRTLFERFERTFSGHFHTRSKDELLRIEYVGTPYELTFADCNDPRGFTVFDTDTRQTEFIQNPHSMFERVIYNNGWMGDVQSLKDKIVKIVVEKKDDLYAFDRFTDSVKLAGVHDLHIMENFAQLASGELGDDINVAQADPIDVIRSYVDNLSLNVDPDRLKTYLGGLYTEAQSALLDVNY